MAKPNYQFEKRRRDMEKKAKKEEKRLRKLQPGYVAPSDEIEAAPAPDGEAAETSEEPT